MAKIVEQLGANVPRHNFVLRYSKSADAYRLSSNSAQTHIATGDLQDYEAYLRNEFSKIFPVFDATKHEVTCSNGPETPYDRDSVFHFHLYDRQAKAHLDNKEIEPGIYTIVNIEHSWHFKPMEFVGYEYVDVYNNKAQDLLKHITTFFDSKEHYDALKCRYKESALLFGPPGCGKTTEILKVAANLTELQLYCIFIPKKFDLEDINNFRQCFQGKRVLFILEELTERTENNQIEDLLSFLDGELSWDNTYTVATTNYPEELPPNLVDRPGRFTVKIKFDAPNDEEKTIFLKQKGVPAEEIVAILPETKGLSIDYLSQGVLRSRIEKISLLEYFQKVKKTRDFIKNNFKGQKLGV